jgi:hypothetical protein
LQSLVGLLLSGQRTQDYNEQFAVAGVRMPVKQSPRVDDPDYWRFRANNTRELAKESNDPSTKSVLVKIAEAYEALAERTAERLRQKPQV